MEVKIFSLKNGYEHYDNVKAIRIKSKDYNLLIMKDYLPVIGKIDGEIDIERGENGIHLEHVEGFYMLTNDIFQLVLKGNKDASK